MKIAKTPFQKESFKYPMVKSHPIAHKEPKHPPPLFVTIISLMPTLYHQQQGFGQDIDNIQYVY